MKFSIYNTMQRKVVPFKELEKAKVKMYCCGPTVYNFAHIGNLRSFLFEDFLRRALEYSGYQVTQVMNITDVGHLTDDGDEGEDKMIKAAREKGMTVWDIAAYFTEAFLKDVEKLNIQKPHILPKATEHIQEMIDLIKGLEAKGLTYQAGGNVYFDTAKLPDYGKLAGLDREKDQAASRVEGDSNKKDPRDFVLWFTQSKFEGQAMTWDSPWGHGYPGWHLECSAMSMKYLGEQMDIHCGGTDHIRVHHTNEIAQSEGLTGKSWVKYWLHGEFLVMGKDKMSKSTGNFITLQTLIDKGYHPLDYRYFCLGGAYRSHLTFKWQALDAAAAARKSLNKKIATLKQVASAASEKDFSAKARDYQEQFHEAVSTDLALPKALSVLHQMLKDSSLKAAEQLALAFDFDRVLGLDFVKLEAEQPASVELNSEEEEMLKARAEARKNKDWAESDRLRDKLAQRGLLVKDGPNGQEVIRQ